MIFIIAGTIMMSARNAITIINAQIVPIIRIFFINAIRNLLSQLVALLASDVPGLKTDAAKKLWK